MLRPSLGRRPGTVEHVIAIEPEPYLRQRARQHAADATIQVQVDVLAGDAAALPVAQPALGNSAIIVRVALMGSAITRVVVNHELDEDEARGGGGPV